MKRITLFSLGLLVFLAAPASAQRKAGFHGWGPRAGVTINPDQVHGGVHFDLGDLARRLMLFPNAEIGFGDNLTVLTTMFEVDYRFHDHWGSWNPYLGGGIGPVFAWHDRGDSGTDLGLTVQGGIARQLTSQPGFMFLEVKLGLADNPDVKFTVGWNFGSSGGGASR